MKIFRLVLILLLSMAFLLYSCGGDGEADTDTSTGTSETAAPDTLVIHLTDTIGVEMGDSVYVFGMLMDAGHGENGEIVALDMQKSRLSVFSPEGEFQGYIGSPGPGPGEFQVPVDFGIMSDGGYAVVDAVGRNISFFDNGGEYVDMVQDFFPTPPMSIEGGPNGSFVGQSMSMVMTGQEMEASLEIGRWSDSGEQDVVYMQKPLDLNIEGAGAATIQRGPEVDFAVGPDGSVFVAEVSDTLFHVRGYSPEGEEILFLSEEFQQTAKTQEELDAGALGLSINVNDGEASANMNRIEDVYPWRNVIESIGVDSERRIWVEMGNTDSPFFRVYDNSGNLLFYAVTDADFSRVTSPTFIVDHGGIIACDRDPIDYPKIFLFSFSSGGSS